MARECKPFYSQLSAMIADKRKTLNKLDQNQNLFRSYAFKSITLFPRLRAPPRKGAVRPYPDKGACALNGYKDEFSNRRF